MKNEYTRTPDVAAISSNHSVLDAPPRLLSSKVLGPSAVFTALAIGSGELIFWPGLSLSFGAGVLWVALFSVVAQYVMNIEIGRFSVATGESVVVGATRLWRGWGVILLLGTIVPWLWPGWARAGSQLLAGSLDISETPITIISLVICGLLLGISKTVYKVVEKIQSFFLILIILGVFALFLMVMAMPSNSGSFWMDLVEFRGVGSLALALSSSGGTEYLTLLGGVVFAGAGGILNLGYGLMICEKNFGMGKYSRPIVGLFQSAGLEMAIDTPKLEDGTIDEVRWKKWMRLLRQEHALLFLAGNSFTIIFLSLIFFKLFGVSSGLQGTSFLAAANASLNAFFGEAGTILFTTVAFLILFTSEIGIIDVTSRLASGIFRQLFPNSTISPSKVFHLVVWIEIAIGTILTLTDLRQPFFFLITSAFLNILVMSIYSGLVAYLNRAALPRTARPSVLSTGAMWLFSLIFFAFFVFTILKYS